MFLIRSLTGRGFRRGGVPFHHDRWTAIEDPSDEILSEPNLECIDGWEGSSSTYEGLPVVNPTSGAEDAQSALRDPASVVISWRRDGMAQILCPPEIEVRFEFVDEFAPATNGVTEELVDFESLIPEEWSDAEDESVSPTEATDGESNDAFAKFKGLGSDTKAALVAAGITTVDGLKSASDEALLAIAGIGPKKLSELRDQLR